MAKARKYTSSKSKKKTDKDAHAHACTLPQVPPRVFATELHPHRARLIMMSDKKWTNGTVLR